MEILALLAGLTGLWLGTGATIKGAVSIADRLHVSEFIVGVAILSIGSDIQKREATLILSLYLGYVIIKLTST